MALKTNFHFVCVLDRVKETSNLCGERQGEICEIPGETLQTGENRGMSVINISESWRKIDQFLKHQ